MAYHITIIDMFHLGDDDAAWDGGTYETAEAAIAAVKSGIDHELKHFWTEEASLGEPTIDRLISRYLAFAEMPVAYGPDHKTIFDSRGYVAARASEMIADSERPPPAPFGSGRGPMTARGFLT